MMNESVDHNNNENGHRRHFLLSDNSTIDWDTMVRTLLEQDGIVCIPLPEFIGTNVIAPTFRSSQLAMDRIHEYHNNPNTNTNTNTTINNNKKDNNNNPHHHNYCTILSINGTNDSLMNVTGYHPNASLNSMSQRYNQYREGFIF